MPDNPFDRLVAAMDSAMVVVTAAVGHERGGCLVGFHCQTSIDPRRYAVWLSKANRTAAIAWRAEHLAVHVLGDHQHDLAELFGGETGDEIDKLARVTWTEGPGGVPLLDGCRHRFLGRAVEYGDGPGDHLFVVMEPIDVVAEGPLTPLRLSDVGDIEPGHPA